MEKEHPIDLSPQYRQNRFKEKSGHQGKLQWLKVTCSRCGGKCNSWDRRVWQALMYDFPKCEKCMAKEYGETIEDFRKILQKEFDMLPCEGI